MTTKIENMRIKINDINDLRRFVMGLMTLEHQEDLTNGEDFPLEVFASNADTVTIRTKDGRDRTFGNIDPSIAVAWIDRIALIKTYKDRDTGLAWMYAIIATSVAFPIGMVMGRMACP